MRPDALIFDLFGTLVFFDPSSVPTMEVAGRTVPMTVQGLPDLLASHVPGTSLEAFLAALRAAGREIQERKRREGIEVPTRTRFEQALLACGARPTAAADAARQMAARHMDSLAAAVTCPPGRRSLLDHLARDYRLALLSNFDDGPTARRILATHDLDSAFEVIVISEEEGIRKPSPGIFRRACDGLGLEAGRCLYIGDTLVEDIEGASGAGLGAVWIRQQSRKQAGLHAGQLASPALAELPDVDALPAWLSSGGPAGAPR